MIKIKLEDDKVKFLQDCVNKGPKNAREITRARILLLTNQQKGDTEIARTLWIDRSTAWRIRKNILKKVSKVLFLTNQDLVSLKNILKDTLRKS